MGEDVFNYCWFKIKLSTGLSVESEYIIENIHPDEM